MSIKFLLDENITFQGNRDAASKSEHDKSESRAGKGGVTFLFCCF